MKEEAVQVAADGTMSPARKLRRGGQNAYYLDLWKDISNELYFII